jgi:hypothetical protein
MFIVGRKKVFFTVLPVNANHTPLDHFIRLYLVYISLPIILLLQLFISPKGGPAFYGFFFDKVTIYNILGLLLGTSCDIFGGNAIYENKNTRRCWERSGSIDD